MSVVWTVIKRASLAGVVIAMIVILVDVLTFHLNATVIFTCFGIAVFFLILLGIAVSKLDEKKYPRRATARAQVNVDEQSTRQHTTLRQGLAFLPTNTSNVERPQSPVGQRISETMEDDHPPSYEEVVQNRVHYQGSEICPRGSCCASRHLLEQMTGTNRVAVYFVSLPLEDSTVPNSTSQV
jgi:hypothetical protein